MSKRYKFLKLKNNKLESSSGNEIWSVGKWEKFDGELKMCESGFHCSKDKYNAFSYVQGEILAEVEVKGKSIKEKNKEVWSEMRLVKLWKWQKKDSVALSIFSAELCLNNFEKVYPDDKRPREAIEAAKRWLKEPIEANKLAAWSAAESVESVATESVAESAKSAWLAAWSAWSAAWSAAESVESAESAWSAAWSAMESTVKSATIKKIQNWINKRKLEKYE